MSTSWTSRVAGFRLLSATERRLLLEALCLLPIIEVRMRFGGFRAERRALARVPMGPSPADPAVRARTVARLVSAASRHGPYRSRCLATSLVLQRLLRRSGIHGDLRIGVRRHGARLEAHAWIEHEGVALLEADVHDRFAAFAPLRATLP